MKATFYATSKRINSFENPETTYISKTEFDDVYFKDDGISMTRPRLYIASGNFPETAYCVIEDFGNTHRPAKLYYFVREISQDSQGRWYVDLELDVLLTYKDSILSQAAYVERSASNYNTQIADPEIKQEAPLVQTLPLTSDALFSDQANTGTYILTALSALPNGRITGMATSWAMTASGMLGVANALIQSGPLEDLKKTFADVSSCLLEVRYSPFARTQLATGEPGNVWIGTFNTQKQVGYMLNLEHLTNTIIITIPKYFNDFRDTTATKYSVFLPCVGLVEISAQDISGADELWIYYTYDPLSGEIAYAIRTPQRRIGTYIGQADVVLPAAVYSRNMKQLVGAVVTLGSIGVTLGGLAASGAALTGAMGLGAMAGTVGAGAAAIMGSQSHTASIIGNYSGNIGKHLGNKIEFIQTATRSADAPANIRPYMGSPLHKVVVLNTLSGYTKTKNFRVKNSGYMTLEEQRSVENMFNYEGVFI